MTPEAGAEVGLLCPTRDDDATKIQELYGLALRVLPPALVMALAEPLLLQPEAAVAPILYPARVPPWWHSRPLRRWYERAQGIRNSGTSTK
jgi:hypothetical protein